MLRPLERRAAEAERELLLRHRAELARRELGNLGAGRQLGPGVGPLPAQVPGADRLADVAAKNTVPEFVV